MTMSNLRDNDTRGKVGDFLKQYIEPDAKLSIVSAYFTIYAYEKLKDKLDNISSLDFLFGEPNFVSKLDPEKNSVQEFKVTDKGEMTIANTLYQKQVAINCAKWIEKKVNIRSVKQANFLHGKLYHIDNQTDKKAILGSSNFTIRGLGFGSKPNLELNIIIEGESDKEDLKSWFDALWNDKEKVEDVKKEVLSYLEKLYTDNSPEWIYFKTLYHIFHQYLLENIKEDDIERRIGLYDTKIWQELFDFQRSGVKGIINKINTYNGCILADSVGLGKTYSALAVIKYFELRNYRVLVLCPKKLRDNWIIYLRNDFYNSLAADRFKYDVLSHTDLSRAEGVSGDIDLSSLNWGNYDLVVIDESHNFRNNTKGKRDEFGNVIRKSRYERLLQDIMQAGTQTKVLLLSATPVNNTMTDLRNQLYIISEGRDNGFEKSLEINSLKSTLANAQKIFTEWAEERKNAKNDATAKDLVNKFGMDFFKLLDSLTIARTRKQIKEHFPEDMKRIGTFPKRKPNIAKSPNIDTEKEFPSYDILYKQISQYQLSLFNPSKYLKSKVKESEKYEVDKVANFTQEQREHYLIGMMRVNFLKRLESSVHSFQISLQRTIGKIQELENKIARYEESQAKIEIEESDFNIFSVEEQEDIEYQQVIREVFQVGKKLKFELTDIDTEAWKNDLAKDKESLQTMAIIAGKVGAERDEKLLELKKLIEEKSKQTNKKILIFTAYADTAMYLYDNLFLSLKNELGLHSALITGGSIENKTTFGKNTFLDILTNFSPISKKRPTNGQNEEISVLIATDCISEGQNLQDCDMVVNYDIHWNPVRLIQRFGRIDRIGSKNESIQMVNFWVTNDLDQYINLRERVEARMALATAITEHENILTEEEISNELSFRDKQLLSFKEEVLDLEDLDESLSFADFSLDQFRNDLLEFIKQNEKALRETPIGIYAVVPPNTQTYINEGVIFCFKQVENHTEANAVINPLQPYFLAYVYRTGEVRFTFTNPKIILSIYRELCFGKKQAYKKLCELFDQEIQHGKEIESYNEMMKKALDDLMKRFNQKSGQQLTQSRSAVLTSVKKNYEQFELITWLVISSK